MLMTTLGDLFGDVVYLEKRGMAFEFRHESTYALQAHQHAFDGEFAQRPIDGHPADAELIEQLALGGQLEVRSPDAGTDLLKDDVFDSCIERGRAFQSESGQRCTIVRRVGHCLFLGDKWGRTGTSLPFTSRRLL